MSEGGGEGSGRRNLVLGTAFLVPARLVGMAATFGLGIVLARFLGAEGAGSYFWGYSVFVVVGVLLRFGTQSAVVESVAVTLVDALEEHRQRLGALIVLAVVPSIVVSLGGVALLLTTDVERGQVVGWFLLALLPYGMVVLPAAIARGAGKTLWMALEFGGHPMLVLVGVGVAAAVFGAVGDTVAAFAVVTAVLGLTGVAATLHLVRSLGIRPRMPAAADLASAFRATRPFLLLSLGALAFTWTDVLVVGTLRSPAETGIYAAAAKTCGLIGLIVSTLELAVAPVIAGSRASGQTDTGEWAYLVSTRWCGVSTLFACGALAVLATPALSLFGPEFVSGTGILFVLLSGQLVNGLAGPVAMVAAMGGLQQVVERASTALMVGNGILNVMLVSWLGATGAAVATVLSIAAFKGYLVYALGAKLDWSPWRAWNIPMLIPPLLGTLVLWAGWRLGGPEVGLLSAGAVVGLSITVFVLTYLGIAATPRERDVALDMVHRLRARSSAVT